MCKIDNMSPCYHAAKPLADGDITVGMFVAAPRWHACKVTGWELAEVVEVTPVTADATEQPYAVRFIMGGNMTLCAYSLAAVPPVAVPDMSRRDGTRSSVDPNSALAELRSLRTREADSPEEFEEIADRTRGLIDALDALSSGGTLPDAWTRGTD